MRAGKQTASSAPDSIVDRVYEALKGMAVSYSFKPGERVNEGDVAKLLGVSRTPLREALNRLNTEGFLRFVPGRGFYCRELDPNDILDLYQLRMAIEVAAVRLAIKRVTKEELDSLRSFLEATGPDPGDRSPIELVELDETFHNRLMQMSRNAEMKRVLQNVNERIRFVRWIDLDSQHRKSTQVEHRKVLDALEAGDEPACIRLLETHISRRLDEITTAIKEGYAKIYMPSEQTTDLMGFKGLEAVRFRENS